MPAKKENVAIPQTILLVYERMIAGLPDVQRKGATLPYTSVNGHMFSFIGQDGAISLRLPEEARINVIRDYNTSLSQQHGVTMKEYVTIPSSLLKNETALHTLFVASYEYVKTLKPKPTKAQQKIKSAK